MPPHEAPEYCKSVVCCVHFENVVHCVPWRHARLRREEVREIESRREREGERDRERASESEWDIERQRERKEKREQARARDRDISK